ncbi:MAG: hypothetical protein K2W96_12545 [Gemmataceae bacterium]|nr:hypothetical protein [Gemmataceae bacterium]
MSNVAHLTDFPVRAHVSYGFCYVAEAWSHSDKINCDTAEMLMRYDLKTLLDGKAERGNWFAHDPALPHPPSSHFALDPPSISARRFAHRAEDFNGEVYHDYLPDGPSAARQFLLTNVRGERGDFNTRLKPPVLKEGEQLDDGLTPDEITKPHWSFMSYRCEVKPGPKGKGWKPGPWKREAVLNVAFKEHFQAFQKGDSWFFLTASGRLFVCGPGAEPGKRGPVRHVIGDARRPVLATVVDALKDKTFLFLATDKGPAFFELSDKPKLVHYAPKLAKVPEGDEPLRSVMHKARVLAALGRIKGK